jgi:hypothetical protein
MLIIPHAQHRKPYMFAAWRGRTLMYRLLFFSRRSHCTERLMLDCFCLDGMVVCCCDGCICCIWVGEGQVAEIAGGYVRVLDS